MTRAHKIGLLAALYVAQGLPYGFFTQALPVLLRDAGLSLKAISATSLLFLPWALKFLWAPFVDHTGTRRAWLLPLQIAAVGSALMHTANYQEFFAWAFGAMVVQVLAYAVTTRMLKMARDQIESNNSAFGGLLGAISISIGVINGACIS